MLKVGASCRASAFRFTAWHPHDDWWLPNYYKGKERVLRHLEHCRVSRETLRHEPLPSRPVKRKNRPEKLEIRGSRTLPGYVRRSAPQVSGLSPQVSPSAPYSVPAGCRCSRMIFWIWSR